jgi:hypothetical protein
MFALDFNVDKIDDLMKAFKILNEPHKLKINGLH